MLYNDIQQNARHVETRSVWPTIEMTITFICGTNFQISVDGLVGFSEETSYRQIHYSAGSDDPAKDLPFIGPFHYHGDKPPVSRSYQGDVFYRLIADRQTLDDLSVYVLNSTVGHRSFRPAMALRVTWLNVTDALSLEDEGCSAVRGSANQCPVRTQWRDWDFIWGGGGQNFIGGGGKRTVLQWRVYNQKSNGGPRVWMGGGMPPP